MNPNNIMEIKFNENTRAAAGFEGHTRSNLLYTGHIADILSRRPAMGSQHQNYKATTSQFN